MLPVVMMLNDNVRFWTSGFFVDERHDSLSLGGHAQGDLVQIAAYPHPFPKAWSRAMYFSAMVEVDKVRYLLDEGSKAPSMRKQHPTNDSWSLGSPAKLLSA